MRYWVIRLFGAIFVLGRYARIKIIWEDEKLCHRAGLIILNIGLRGWRKIIYSECYSEYWKCLGKSKYRSVNFYRLQ